MKDFWGLMGDMKADLMEVYFNGKLLFLGGAMSGVLWFVKTFLFADTQFLIWLVVVMVMDMVAKLVFLYGKKEKPSLKAAIDGFLNKSLRYAIYLITCYVLVNFEVGGIKLAFLQNFNMLLYGILIIKEVNSITRSLGIGLPKAVRDLIDAKFEDNEKPETFGDGEPRPGEPRG